MGGCCSSSRNPELRGTPVYYYYPPHSDERRLFIDLNLNMPTPDTYRSPPAPMPYDVVLGRAPSTEVVSGELTHLGKPSSLDPKEANCETQSGFPPESPRKADLMLNSLADSYTDEEDVCPTCLEEYDAENPKIVTKCKHHFHLSCMLEWMERSDTCPVCNQEMIYEAL